MFRATSQPSAALAEPAMRPHLPPHGGVLAGLHSSRPGTVRATPDKAAARPEL